MKLSKVKGRVSRSERGDEEIQAFQSGKVHEAIDWPWMSCHQTRC